MSIKIILYVILTNIILYLVSLNFGLQRPIVNLDYVFIFIFYMFFCKLRIAKAISVALIFFFGCLDIVLFINQLFPFVQLNDLFYLSTFIFTGPILYQKIFYACITYLIIISLLSVKYFFSSVILTSSVKRTLYALCLFCIVLSFLDMKKIRSQTVFFVKNYTSNYHDLMKSERLLAENRYDSLSKNIFNNLDLANRKILLVVNESWGMPNNLAIQKELLKPIYQKKSLYDFVEDGGFHFFGATISGELRELCQKNALVMDITLVDDNEFKNCLPYLLKQKGYETYSVHAARGKLYDRERWYAVAGFKTSLFKENFNEYRQCKAFSGKCDYDLVEPIVDILGTNDKVFIYWLTLNTHAPYTDHLFIDGFDCEKYALNPQSEACLNFKHQYQFFTRLSEYVNDPRMQGVEVLIVGDHSPPIMDIKSNFSVYKGLDVAWLWFKIK